MTLIRLPASLEILKISFACLPFQTLARIDLVCSRVNIGRDLIASRLSRHAHGQPSAVPGFVIDGQI
jgi:hypothetical protein